MTRPGVNLIRNGGAEFGDASGNGYDAVTIPGWRVAAGLPSVIRYGLARFVPASAPRPDGSGRQLLVGGAGGPAVLAQKVPLVGPSGRRLYPGTTYDLSAALGARGSRPEAASVQLRFLDGRNRLLSTVTLGPVTARQRGGETELLRRQHIGLVPAKARRAIVRVRLETAAKDYNGPYGSRVGFNSAYADDVHLSLSSPTEARGRLRPPMAKVPRYRHVVVVYLENQDYHDIVGNSRQAPFTNQLISSGSVLSRSYAEEHPSDANYLALAAGSALDLPLTDPAEENSQYTVDARNIGDLVNAAHETWKAYLQSADGPCDDTVHNQYWDDDLPFLYFRDVRQQPAYCAAHVVPESQWRSDLRRPGSTPSFSWLGANDCDDMEGCGIKAGDLWLRSVITPLLRSRAWRTQRTLLIATWDEDAEDGQHPAQRVPTVIVGSRLVKRGYVARVRATHYSLLRTIEAALGLGTLTDNDRYALPVNDVFERGKGTPAGLNAPTDPVKRAARTRLRPGAAGDLPKDAADSWVVDSMTGTVTPVDMATGRRRAPVAVGRGPDAAIRSPGGVILWVANGDSGTITPVDTAARRAERAVRVGSHPSALALTPDGRTLLVANAGSGTITPVNLATRRAGPPIRVGRSPSAVIVSRRDDVAYVLDHGSGTADRHGHRQDRPAYPRGDVRVSHRPRGRSRRAGCRRGRHLFRRHRADRLGHTPSGAPDQHRLVDLPGGYYSPSLAPK